MSTATPQLDREQEALILDGIDRFLERDVRPHVSELEHNDIYPAEIAEKLKEMGLFGATISEEYGGLGLPITTYAKIIEKMSGVWMAVSGIINSHLIMAAAIERHGTDEEFSSTGTLLRAGSDARPKIHESARSSATDAPRPFPCSEGSGRSCRHEPGSGERKLPFVDCGCRAGPNP